MMPKTIRGNKKPTMRTGMASRLLIACAALAAMSLPALAQSVLGPVTGLPMPRYVSIKATEANARRGPAKTHRIDWVYQQRGYPVRVIAEFGHWRKIVDIDGEGGWIHYALLSNARNGLVVDTETVLRYEATVSSQVRARLEPGVVLVLENCNRHWCFGSVDQLEGWVRKTQLWGVEAEDIFD